MIAVAFLLSLAADEPGPPDQRVAVERFVSACVNGELSAAGLREVSSSDLPSGIRAHFRRRPTGRYYRFDERSPSYLIVINDARPDAEHHAVCALASRAGGPWPLFSAVMHRLRPETRAASSQPSGVPRSAQTLSASMTNHELGYSIQAERIAGYTVIQSLQFRPKNETARPDGAAKE